MQADRGNAFVVDHVGELFGKSAGPCEHQCLAALTSQLDDHVALVALVNNPHLVVNRRRLLVFASDFKDGRVAQELAHNVGDSSVQSGREQQPLAIRGRCAEDALQRLDESELTHVVRLVDNRNHDLRHIKLAPGDQVFDASGSSDDDVNTALKSPNLTADRNTTINLGREQANAAGNGLHGAINLKSQLPGGGKDQSTWCATNGALHTVFRHLQQALDQRSTESNGLAGTRAATSQNVAATQCHRNGRSLQSKRRGSTQFFDGVNDAGTKTQIAKC